MASISRCIPGERLAVVGLNGAGKTTLVKLLCGFYDPTEGRVLLNGEDIREFNRQEYYTLFTAVFQKFSVLEATLEENVAQTREGIDEARVRECLEKAGLTERVGGAAGRSQNAHRPRGVRGRRAALRRRNAAAHARPSAL